MSTTRSINRIIPEEKFTDEIYFNDYEVLSPDGFKDFRGIGKTIPFQEHHIYFKETSTAPFICADTHILILHDNTERFAKDLAEGDRVKSSTHPQGYLTIESVIISDKFSEMYDLLDVDGGIYNTSNIVSHNSTITAGVALHYAIFKSSQKIAILANKDDLAKELLGKVTVAYENLPSWMQHGIKSLTAHEMVLENNSRIFARPTSKSAVRGKSISLLILDEFAHVDNNIADEFYAAVFPTISSGTTTKLVIISTPNKYNLYHKLWSDAIHGRNTFHPIRVDWWEVPGHDEVWKAEQISNTTKEQFAQEHELSFDSSSNGLISAEKIKELIDNHCEPIQKDDDDCLYIYEKPIEGEEYIIIVDSSHGVERDYSAFMVIKISTSIHELVAVYRNNKISPLVYPDIIYKVGINYNEAHILVENNDIGSQVATILQFEYEYPNLLYTELTNKKQRVAYGNDGKCIIGIKTTASVKAIGCSNLKAAVEHDKLIIKDYNTISELSTFIKVRDSYQADEGSHDDLVMGLVLYSWLLTQNYFKDVEQNLSSDIKDIYENSINDNMICFGFFTSGKPDDIIEAEDDDLIDRKMGWTKAKEWGEGEENSNMSFYY